MKKPILIFCNNYLGFTLLSSGGVLQDLIANFHVTILTSLSAERTIRTLVGPDCRVVARDRKGSGLQSLAYGLIGDILGMTYAAKDGRRNKTAALHRKAHLKLVEGKGFAPRLRKKFVVRISELAENCRITRKVLNRLFYLFAPKGEFADILRDVRPVLSLATTAGLGKDGVFFAASHQAGVPCLALIQSWDRTASKGYPANHPDYCIVWNDPMAKEAEIFLEIPKEHIFVEGAPPWDEYTSDHEALKASEKEVFYQRWNLEPDKKLIFVALNGPATHGENLRLIRDLGKALVAGAIENAQIMFRSHPAYLIDKAGTEDLERAFAELKNPDLHMMNPIVSDPLNKDYVVTAEDRKFMHDMFRACDLTVSIMSTWMIESAIFDKPNICIEYGRYTTQLYDFDLSEYKAEHIARIFGYGAVHRVASPEMMVATIGDVLLNPDRLRANRKALAEAEAGPNKGNARAAFLRRIQEITRSL